MGRGANQPQRQRARAQVGTTYCGGHYQSAKWAVGGFSEVLAREVAPLGIRVTCVEPGGMRTDMFGLSMLVSRSRPITCGP